MSFVFLSHANCDKPKVKPIAEALIGAGFKVWVDHPHEMGISDHYQFESDVFDRQLISGEKWQAQIDRALREADAVLMFWSQAAKDERNVWFLEASVARTNQKLVSCRIDTVDPRGLPDGHGDEEIIDLSQNDCKATLDLLIESVRKKCEGTRAHNADRRDNNGTSLDDLTYYTVDRSEQLNMLEEKLSAVREGGVAGPFVMAGPENECLDKFVRRIERLVLPKYMGGTTGHCIYPEWPAGARPTAFERDYRFNLTRSLDACVDASDAGLAQALCNPGRPVIVVSLLPATEWRDDETGRIESWVKFWNQLGKSCSGIPLLPVLQVDMGQAEAGWSRWPSGTREAHVSNAEIVISACRLSHGCRRPAMACKSRPKILPPCRKDRGPDGGCPGVPFFLLPIFEPIKKGHAQTWAKSPDRAPAGLNERTVADAIEHLYPDERAAHRGVPMKKFVEEMMKATRTARR